MQSIPLCATCGRRFVFPRLFGIYEFDLRNTLQRSISALHTSKHRMCRDPSIHTFNSIIARQIYSAINHTRVRSATITLRLVSQSQTSFSLASRQEPLTPMCWAFEPRETTYLTPSNLLTQSRRPCPLAAARFHAFKPGCRALKSVPSYAMKKRRNKDSQASAPPLPECDTRGMRS